MFDENFPQWLSAKRLNDTIGLKGDIRYILILTRTDSFNAIHDIQKALRITKKPNTWFVSHFRRHSVRIHYGTLFSERDKRHLGPIASKTSEGIVGKLLQKFYGSCDVQYVCHHTFVKRLSVHVPGIQFVSPDTLADKLLEFPTEIPVKLKISPSYSQL